MHRSHFHTVVYIYIYISCRGVQKTEIWFGFGYKKIRTVQKFDIRADGFSDRNCLQSAVQIKSDKNNFTYIHCADKEHFKTQPKQGLAYDIHSLFNTAQ